MEFTKQMEAYWQAQQEPLKQLIRDLCAIPAPSHHEQARAEFCKNWFRQAGCEEAYVDEALNAICPYGDTGNNPLVVVMAHTDTVFPDTEPLPFRETPEAFYCPGVCDDTANLAVMMLCAKFFIQNKIQPKTGIIFVANSCEEGLGNLKGSRHFFDVYGDRVQEFVTFDGFDLTDLVDRAVGSHRYQVTVKTIGGHSFNNFGNKNAIACLSQLIAELYGIQVPQVPGTKTTYNVGQISGGTSVNTIAQSANMLFEYRSDNRECLAYMQQQFESILASHRNEEVAIEVECIGERPCSGDVDPARQQALLERAQDSVRRIVGREPVCNSGSTDCNIPLSRGIPAICLGVCTGKGIHTREEVLSLSSLPGGLRLGLDFLRYYFV